MGKIIESIWQTTKTEIINDFKTNLPKLLEDVYYRIGSIKNSDFDKKYRKMINESLDKAKNIFLEKIQSAKIYDKKLHKKLSLFLESLGEELISKGNEQKLIADLNYTEAYQKRVAEHLMELEKQTKTEIDIIISLKPNPFENWLKELIHPATIIALIALVISILK